MKHSVAFLLSILVLLPFLSSCESVLTVDPIQVETASEFVSKFISIDVNNDWEATSSATDWCTVSPSKGNKNTTSIKITVQENTTYSDRSCNVTIVSGDKSQVISVKQSQNDAIIIETREVSISNLEQTFALNVSSNVQYDVTPQQDWIIPVETKALSSNTFTFLAEANQSMESRTGFIKIEQKNSDFFDQIKVVQKQKDSIIIPQNNIYFDWSQSSTALAYKSNVVFAILQLSGRDWLHVEKNGDNSEGSILISADTYVPTPDSGWDKDHPDRVGVIKIGGGDFFKNITITQRSFDYIWISRAEMSLYVGKSGILQAKAFLHEGIDDSLYWTSSNESVATVVDGNIQALSRGTAIITVSNSDNSFYATCVVRVKEIIDDISIAARGAYLSSAGGHAELTFHSKIYIPSEVNSVQYYSVWLCRPDGTAYDIVGTTDGYARFAPIYYNGYLNDAVLDYFSTWFVLYQVQVDGIDRQFYRYVDAHTWGGIY